MPIKSSFFTIFMILLVSNFASSQVGIIAGVNLGRYTYMESAPHNYSSQFNNGWAIKMDEGGQIVYFAPTVNNYQIKDRMNWDRYNRGFKIGCKFNSDKRIDFSFYFMGATNTSTGKRIDMTTGGHEKFKVKSKFGGLYGEIIYKVTKRINLNGALGFERYKLCYSYENDSINRKMSPMGWHVKVLSGQMKPKSKNMNFTVGLGVGYTIYSSDNFSIDFISQYRWAINALSEVYRGVFYNKYLFNLNSWNNSIQIVYHL